MRAFGAFVTTCAEMDFSRVLQSFVVYGNEGEGVLLPRMMAYVQYTSLCYLELNLFKAILEPYHYLSYSVGTRTSLCTSSSLNNALERVSA
jgi:hypothetical protein